MPLGILQWDRIPKSTRSLAIALHNEDCGCPSGVRMPPHCVQLLGYSRYLKMARAANRHLKQQQRSTKPASCRAQRPARA
jgi:hypothetical protein